MATHNWWHFALYQLEIGNERRVLDLYDERIRPTGSEVVLDLVDASSMLWRLQVAGVAVGDRWEELADCWNRVQEEGFYAFNDWHAVMAHAAQSNDDDVQRLLDGLQRAAVGTGTNARLSRDVGLPCCRGFAAFAKGDYASAVDELFRVRSVAHTFGGSNAQRDILDCTLIEAAKCAGQHGLANALIEARGVAKPGAHSPIRMRDEVRRASDRVGSRPVRAA
jgi:hypothetical protein